MPSYSQHEVVLVTYPFSDLSGVKIRPAVIVSGPHRSSDLFIVPLTSKTSNLFAGEFLLSDWRGAGLHVPTAVKRGLFTVQDRLVVKRVGNLEISDVMQLEQSLRLWLDLT